MVHEELMLLVQQIDCIKEVQHLDQLWYLIGVVKEVSLLDYEVVQMELICMYIILLILVLITLIVLVIYQISQINLVLDMAQILIPY